MSTCSSVVSGGGAGGGAGGSSGGGGAGGAGGAGGPCGACKFLRRKCVHGCIFAPYFDQEAGAAHFAAVHKVFGASNVAKLLHQIHPDKRVDAVVTVCYEAQARLRDPVFGCVAHIFALQQQIANLQSELSFMQSTLATMELPLQQQAAPFPVQPQMMPLTTGGFSVSNLPSSSTMVPANLDLSALVLDQQQQQQQLQLQQNQYAGMGGASTSGDAGGSGTGIGDGIDLHALARALLDKHRLAGVEPPNPRGHQ